MAQGNLGYKTGKGKFAIHDILRELKYPPRNSKVDIDTTDYSNPYPTLEYLITMAIGYCQQIPGNNEAEIKLNSYIQDLYKNNWTTRKINGMVLSIMNKKNLGVEIYRCMGGAYQR